MKFVLLAFTFILCFGYSASCCDCGALISLDEANTVFEGKVVSVKKKSNPYAHYEIVFKVDKLIKGDPTYKRQKVIVPSLTEDNCGFPFEKGKRYSVFTVIKGNILHTNACTTTKEI
jgi:hypothetical protein